MMKQFKIPVLYLAVICTGGQLIYTGPQDAKNQAKLLGNAITKGEFSTVKEMIDKNPFLASQLIGGEQALLKVLEATHQTKKIEPTLLKNYVDIVKLLGEKSNYGKFAALYTEQAKLKKMGLFDYQILD